MGWKYTLTVTLSPFWNVTISDYEMYFKNLKKVQKFVKAPAGFKLKNCRSLADAMQSCKT